MQHKKFKISSEEIKKIIDSDIGCIASDMITVHGENVGYMYREEPNEIYDSGWRFFSGKEDQEYVDQADFFAFYKINTIANYDKAIIPYLDFPIGSSLERIEGTDQYYLVK